MLRPFGVMALVAGIILQASALSTSHYVQTSALADGTWVKVKTSGEGIHEISYDQLRQWGLDPEKVQVYGYGATLYAQDVFSLKNPDDVVPTFTYRENDKIYFYSSGLVDVKLKSPTEIVNAHDSYSSYGHYAPRNYYSNDVYYLLSDKDVDLSNLSEPQKYIEGTEPLNAHISVTYVEDELQNPTDGGGIFLGESIKVGEAFMITADVVDNDGGNTGWNEFVLRFGFAALNSNSFTKMTLTYPTGMQSSIASQTYTNAPAAYDSWIRYRNGYTTLSYKRGLANGTYVFTAPHPNNGQTFLAKDYHWFLYPRLNYMRALPQLSMHFPKVSATSNFQIKGAEGTQVFNVTDVTDIYRHELVYNAEDSVFVGTFGRNYNGSPAQSCHLVAFNVNRPQKTVQFVENVANQNYHGIDTPDMVIITTDALYDSAEELANYHRQYDGMDVAVVRHDLLFNEFSSATPHVMGYRGFLKMLYDRNPLKLKYVIMYGDSHWDNRAITVMKKDRLLAFETLNSDYAAKPTQSFVSDCYFGMLADNYNPNNIISTKQNVAVGRIPAENAVQAASYNKKVLHYLQTVPATSVMNTSIMMSDSGDSNQHLHQAEELADSLILGRPAMTVVKAHNSLYDWENGDAKILRAITIDAFKHGTGLFTYVGHGNEDAFGAQNLWNRNYVGLTDFVNIPFGLVASCSIFAFDHGSDSIGKSFLYKEDGGLMAFIASGRVVYGSLNQTLALQIIKCYANARKNTTIGELWMEARNTLLDNISLGYGPESQVNTMCFNLAGDPALKVWVPEYNVNITGVNGNDLASLPSTLKVDALTPVEITGNIVDDEGNILEDFNGSVEFEMYESNYNAEVIVRNSASDKKEQITLDQSILSSAEVKVTNGTFTLNIVSPAPMREDKNNRITFHALADDGRRADGTLNCLQFVTPKGVVQEESDNLAPVIESMSAVRVGDNDVVLVACGTVDAVGFNKSTAVGLSNYLVVDGKNNIGGVNQALRLDANTNSWTLSMPLGNLTLGNHSAVLTLTDNAGRHVRGTVNFTLDNENSVLLTSDVTTVRDKVTFEIEHELGEVTESQLVIEDRMGNPVVYMNNPVFPCSVTLNQPMSQNGEEYLANGHYTAYVRLKTQYGYGNSQRLQLVLLKETEESQPATPEVPGEDDVAQTW